MGVMKGNCRISMLLVTMFFYLHKADGAKPEIDGNLPRGTMKTIYAKDDVIDCVHIYKQPSLDHPLLKNHTIQMRPTSYPTEELLESTHDAFATTVSQSWSENEECPEGTVPIPRRYKPMNESISRVSHRKGLPFTQFNGTSNQPMGAANKFAAAFQRTPGPDRSGVAAIMNLWNPKTEPADCSTAQLWLAYAIGSQAIESVEAGWEVYPQRYHSSPRLFILFTTNGYKSYCYNFDCPGFILVNKGITLGAGFNHVSSYNGDQYVIDITIVQDGNTKNLWFYLGGKVVGYWPRILFKYIVDGGNAIAWGGKVFEAASSRHPTSTAMGSGHFPEEGYKRASFIGSMRYLEGDHMGFPDPDSVSYANTNWKAYHALPLSNDQQSMAELGQHFYLGGPGGH